MTVWKASCQCLVCKCQQCGCWGIRGIKIGTPSVPAEAGGGCLGVAGRAREPGRRRGEDQGGIRRSQRGPDDVQDQIPPTPSTVVPGKPFHNLDVVRDGAGDAWGSSEIDSLNFCRWVEQGTKSRSSCFCRKTVFSIPQSVDYDMSTMSRSYC